MVYKEDLVKILLYNITPLFGVNIAKWDEEQRANIVTLSLGWGSDKVVRDYN